MIDPQSVSMRSPASTHVRAGDSAHQQIVQIGDRAKYYLLAASFIINVICIFTIAFGAFIYYQAKALDQNRYDWLQRDIIMPMQSQVNEHDKEISALMNHQEKR